MSRRVPWSRDRWGEDLWDLTTGEDEIATDQVSTEESYTDFGSNGEKGVGELSSSSKSLLFVLEILNSSY